MAGETNVLIHPCPSCGVSLKVHPDRIGQKMQCPKCLAVFLSVNEPGGGMGSEAPGRRKNGKQRASGIDSEQAEESALLLASVEHLRAERETWIERWVEMSRCRKDLAERYQALLEAHREVVDALLDVAAACDSPDREESASGLSPSADSEPSHREGTSLAVDGKGRTATPDPACPGAVERS